ncbi:MAG: YebC/PmpR family DNA-binding transcriptional regulator [Dehalococcoidia bacterium]|nr:YebC/PmpR family DNA-binding transcriptional regulator [Dehalococcoidia bacterium]
MSGHSKWKTIKHQKGAADAKRGQLFTKLTRELMMAARQGGGDPDMNARLRLAVEKARDGNMPMDNIERAIKRATGATDDQATLEEFVYEGYGPSGVAILVFVVTDNRNRAVSEIRNVMERNGGKLGQAGSVSWGFEQKGTVTLQVKPERAEEVALLAIDLGADDFTIDGSYVELRCEPAKLEGLRKALEAKGSKPETAEIAMVPKTLTHLDDRPAEQALRLFDRLEELDDVQRVATNADFPESVLERYKAAA